MNVLVTGGDGFIGRAVCAALKAEGIESVPVDRASGIDILTDKLPDADGVIHLAGVLGTAELFETIDTAVDVNIKGTVRVLEWCARRGAKYVGITMPQVWSNPYQATKACGMSLAEAYGTRFDFPVTHVCAFNVYGPGQKVHGVQKILPTFASRSWNREPMPVWGSGNQKVDLIHVEDVAATLVDAFSSHRTGMYDEAGSGTPLTVLYVARMVGEITRCSTVEFLPLRAGETNELGVVARKPHIRSDPCRDVRFAQSVDWYREDRP